jgi:hypothetical protein
MTTKMMVKEKRKMKKRRRNAVRATEKIKIMKRQIMEMRNSFR